MTAPASSSVSAAPLATGPVLTARSFVAGFVLAVLLCLVNSYLTLSFGVIEEGPTIAALFFFALFFLSRTRIRSSEMVIVATMGSAGGSLGFIANFFAAKAMTGAAYSVGEMAGFAMVTSLVGMVFVVPLRELLVIKEELPWPQPQATAGVITALVEHGDPRQPWYLLATGAVALFYVVGNDDGGFGWLPEQTAIPLFGLGAYSAAISWSPFATAGSYLMGMSTCVGFLVGGVLLLVLAPVLPEPAAPHHYVWPGIGFLVASGGTVMVLSWRVLWDSLRALGQLSGSHADGDEDALLSRRALVIVTLVALGVTGVFSYFVLDLSVLLIVAVIVVGGFVQNVISTRAAALTAFNPARVMGVLIQGLCAALGAQTAAANLTGAGFVAGSGAQAGMLTGDMVYGRRFGVPARWQFWTQMATIVPCALVSAWVFTKIQATTPLRLEGGALPAPVAKIWATSALIFEGQRPMPPFAGKAMLLAGVVAVIYVLLEEKTAWGRRWMPSSIGLGIGLVLPVAYDFAFFVGGFVMWIVLGRWLKVRDITLTTIAVGCIVAEGIGGVAKPVLTLLGVIHP